MPTSEEIQTCINNLTSCNEITEMVILSAETDKITVNRSLSVATVNDLPDLQTTAISAGTIFFVQSLGFPVMSSEGTWISLDNKIIRQDYFALCAWAWGLNTNGQLGDNTITSRLSPVSVVGGFTDWCQVSGGRDHSLAVRQNGTAWAWGSNGNGRLGDNSTTARSSPVSVVGGFTDWCQVSGGRDHSLAVRQNGTAWAWGYNGQGRLGDDSVTSRRSPVLVVGGFIDWCQISAGRSHSIAVRQNGTAWAWGLNGGGRLGDDTATNRSSPVSVVGGFTDWCQVSAGTHSLAVRQNGTTWAWGSNTNGQLGDGSTVSRSSPVSVVGGFTDWCQISAGNIHSLAVRQNGTAWAWGSNTNGQLGDNTITQRLSPVSVVGGFTDWCQVSSGYSHSLAVRQNGTAWAWGCNATGQLGDNSITSQSSPVSVVGGFTDWCQVSGGGCHSLGLRTF